MLCTNRYTFHCVITPEEDFSVGKYFFCNLVNHSHLFSCTQTSSSENCTTSNTVDLLDSVEKAFGIFLGTLLHHEINIIYTIIIYVMNNIVQYLFKRCQSQMCSSERRVVLLYLHATDFCQLFFNDVSTHHYI